jgi:hypothetical protein
MANSIRVDALAQLFIEKGCITKEESFAKLKGSGGVSEQIQ